METSEILAIALILAIFIGIQITIIRSLKEKVSVYVSQKYHDYSIESIKWTLFGPISPGDSNYKYVVSLVERKKQNKKEIYALTSLWGSVYVRD